MSNEFKVKIEIAHIVPQVTAMTDELFPNLSYAVRRMAQAGQQLWQSYASGNEQLPGGKQLHVRTGTYLRSIQLEQQTAFAWTVFSDAPYAEAIEHGAPAFDMHNWLSSSNKTRISKSGKLYLIIPFRWNTPGKSATNPNTMTPHIHGTWMSGMIASRVKSQRMTTNATTVTGKAMTVTKRQYFWGDRLSSHQIAQAGVTGSQAKNMRGMVNFRKPGAVGGASHSQFLTFRVLSEGSSGWVIPAREGYHPAEATANRIRSLSEVAFGKAVEADLQSWIEGD